MSISRLSSAWLPTSSTISSSCFSIFFASSLSTISVSSIFTCSSSGTSFGLPLSPRTKCACGFETTSAPYSTLGRVKQVQQQLGRGQPQPKLQSGRLEQLQLQL